MKGAPVCRGNHERQGDTRNPKLRDIDDGICRDFILQPCLALMSHQASDDHGPAITLH